MSDMDKDLYTKTIQLAKTTKLSPKEICTNLKVTERWFYKFISGEIKNPGVIHVQNLFNLLIESLPEYEKTDNRHLSDRRDSRRKKVIN